MKLTIPFVYLDPECKKGECDHEADMHIRHRSRFCISGECTHFAHGKVCSVNYDTEGIRDFELN